MTDTPSTLPTEQAVAQLEAADAANPSPTRQLAEELIRSGAVTTETTFADAKEILNRHYAPKR